MSAVVIATFGGLDEAHLLAARLRSAGIEVGLRDETPLGLNLGYSLAIGGVKVVVAEADVEDALAILHDPSSEPAA
jgi:hypothetical protein